MSTRPGISKVEKAYVLRDWDNCLALVDRFWDSNTWFRGDSIKIPSFTPNAKKLNKRLKELEHGSTEAGIRFIVQFSKLFFNFVLPEAEILTSKIDTNTVTNGAQNSNLLLGLAKTLSQKIPKKDVLNLYDKATRLLNLLPEGDAFKLMLKDLFMVRVKICLSNMSTDSNSLSTVPLFRQNQAWIVEESLDKGDLTKEEADNRIRFWLGVGSSQVIPSANQNMKFKSNSVSSDSMPCYSEVNFPPKAVLPRSELPGETEKAKRDLALDFNLPFEYDQDFPPIQVLKKSEELQKMSSQNLPLVAAQRRFSPIWSQVTIEMNTRSLVQKFLGSMFRTKLFRNPLKPPRKISQELVLIEDDDDVISLGSDDEVGSDDDIVIHSAKPVITEAVAANAPSVSAVNTNANTKAPKPESNIRNRSIISQENVEEAFDELLELDELMGFSDSHCQDLGSLILHPSSSEVYPLLPNFDGSLFKKPQFLAYF